MKRILALCLLLCLASLSPTFAAAVAVDALWSGLFDNSGQPLASGKVYFYTTGTTNQKTVWKDSAKATAWTQPITLDAYGRAQVWADGVYGIDIQTSASVSLATINGLTYADPTTVTTTAFTSFTATQGNISSFTSALAFLNNATISSSTWNNGYINGANISNPAISSATIATVIITNATMSAAGDLDMNTHKVTEVATPTAAADATNKLYVDTSDAALTAAIATNTANIAAVTASLTAGDTVAAVASLTAVTTYAVGRDINSTDETMASGGDLASSSTWVDGGSLWSRANGTAFDEYYLMTFTGYTQAQIVATSGSELLLDGTIALMTTTNIYALTKTGYTYHNYVADNYTIQNIPFSLTAIVKAAANTTVDIHFKHKLLKNTTVVNLACYYNPGKSVIVTRLR